MDEGSTICVFVPWSKAYEGRGEGVKSPGRRLLRCGSIKLVGEAKFVPFRSGSALSATICKYPCLYSFSATEPASEKAATMPSPTSKRSIPYHGVFPPARRPDLSAPGPPAR
jgi:hypothetical protein